jgi:hypothetical protein
MLEYGFEKTRKTRVAEALEATLAGFSGVAEALEATLAGAGAFENPSISSGTTSGTGCTRNQPLLSFHLSFYCFIISLF